LLGLRGSLELGEARDGLLEIVELEQLDARDAAGGVDEE
jgi:hypothetical protein